MHSCMIFTGKSGGSACLPIKDCIIQVNLLKRSYCFNYCLAAAIHTEDMWATYKDIWAKLVVEKSAHKKKNPFTSKKIWWWWFCCHHTLSLCGSVWVGTACGLLVETSSQRVSGSGFSWRNTHVYVPVMKATWVIWPTLEKTGLFSPLPHKQFCNAFPGLVGQVRQGHC